MGILELEASTLEHFVRHARHDIAAGGERLSEVAASLQDIGGMALSSSGAELRRAGIRAQADCTQAIVGLVNAMVAAERITLAAKLRELGAPLVAAEVGDV